jgi:hypothetical protein
MFAVVVAPRDLPVGGRLIAEYSVPPDAHTVSLVELADWLPFVLTAERGINALPAETLQEGFDVARRVIGLSGSAPAR